MSPELLGALVNMGSAGAVIAVVIIFLRANKERDAEWRTFFTELNKSNKEDVSTLSQNLLDALRVLEAHDKQAKTILEVANQILGIVKPKRRSGND